MPVVVRLSLEDRLFGLEPLLNNMEPAKASQQNLRFSILEKIEVQRKERSKFFNMNAPAKQQVIPDWDGIESAEELSVDFEKAEVRELISMLDETAVQVDQMRWMRPLRRNLDLLTATSGGVLSISLETRFGLEALISSLEPKKPGEFLVAFDVLSKVRVSRKEKNKYIKEITPSAVNWGAVDAEPEIEVELTKQEVGVMLDDVLKSHKVMVKDVEWISKVREQIASQLKTSQEELSLA